MKKLLFSLTAAAVAVSGFSSTWHEAWNGGDSTDLPGTAQITQGTGALTQIVGSCGTGSDADMYRIRILNPASFSITTVGGTTADTLLFLFDSTGMGIVASDDASGTQSTIDNTGPGGSVAPGTYYVAITRYNRTPASAGGNIWTTYDPQAAPNGPGAASPITGWANTTSTALAYTIHCTGIDPAVTGADEVPPYWLETMTSAAAQVYGTAVITGTISLSTVAPGGGITVALSSSDPAITVPANVTVTAGNTSANFNITGTGTAAVDTPVTITGTYLAESKNVSVTAKPMPTGNVWVEDRVDFPAAMQHGDAGNLIVSAQMTTGNGTLSTIFGKCNAGGDADIYCIKIVDPATFSASLVNLETATSATGGMVDSQIFLFNADGTGIAFNDDNPLGTELQSHIPAGDPLITALTAGTYYLAISRYDHDPVDSGALALWLDTPFDTVRAPDGPGAANPVASWVLTPTGGIYRVDLTGAEYCMPAEVTVNPTTLTPGPGTILAGGVTEISTSDNTRVNMRPGAILVATADPLVLQVVGMAPAATASSLKVQVETRATVAGIRQIVEARNFAAGPNQWTVLETFTPLPFGANPDRAVQFTLTNPNNYIGPSNEIRVRIRCKNTTAVLVYPWQVQFDEVTWRFSP